MAYKPTPRDLFNPPPQAPWPKEITQDELDALRMEIQEAFPFWEHPVRRIHDTLADIVEELAARTGSFR